MKNKILAKFFLIHMLVSCEAISKRANFQRKTTQIGEKMLDEAG